MIRVIEGNELTLSDITGAQKMFLFEIHPECSKKSMAKADKTAQTRSPVLALPLSSWIILARSIPLSLQFLMRKVGIVVVSSLFCGEDP